MLPYAIIIFGLNIIAAFPNNLNPETHNQSEPALVNINETTVGTSPAEGSDSEKGTKQEGRFLGLIYDAIAAVEDKIDSVALKYINKGVDFVGDTAQHVIDTGVGIAYDHAKSVGGVLYKGHEMITNKAKDILGIGTGIAFDQAKNVAGVLYDGHEKTKDLLYQGGTYAAGKAKDILESGAGMALDHAGSLANTAQSAVRSLANYGMDRGGSAQGAMPAGQNTLSAQSAVNSLANYGMDRSGSAQGALPVGQNTLSGSPPQYNYGK